MRVAVVDIGSSALQLVIATVGAEGTITLLGEFCLDTGLIAGMSPEAALLDPASMESTLNGLKSFRHIVRTQGRIEQVRVIASSSIRDSGNLGEFVAEARRILDADVEVLTPSDEAAYGYLGARDVAAAATAAAGDAGAPGAPGDAAAIVVADVGGGCTQIAVGEPERLIDVFTLRLGHVPLARRFLEGAGPSYQEGLALSEHLHEHMNLGSVKEALGRRPFCLVGSGSMITTLASMALGLATYDRAAIHGSKLDKEQVYEWFSLLARTPAAERAGLAGLPAPRAQGILAGTGILLFLMDKLASDEVYVSDRGIRHGVLREMFGHELAFTGT
jgi:exopolyphosphatase/guanosine-5'-triphosphate,3'-diphosphate pyrophosphatase